MSNCGCEVDTKDRLQSRVLILLLCINATMFVIEFGIGWWAESTGLIADALDMLADALVYSIGLYAVGKAASVKTNAAMLSGLLQLLLGLLVISDILRRAIYGSEPVSFLMMGTGSIALIANIVCLRLIMSHRKGEVHMRASWIFSKNDVIANIGVILAGILVWSLNSRWPDIIIGSIVASVVLHGAKSIVMDAIKEKQRLNT